MSTIYDGRLTAWLDIELDKVLIEILPPQSKYYEGREGLEIKTKHPQYNETKRKLIALARDYAAKQNSGQYDKPQEVSGEVHHGFQD